MEKNEEYKNQLITLELIKHPQFGTNCKEIDQTNYFFPFISHGKYPFKNGHISIDCNSYHNKEVFFIYIYSENEGKIKYK